MGAKSTYSKGVADQICARMSSGEPLAAICRSDDMPGYRTVYDWMDAHADFAANIARARLDGYDVIASDCLEIADDARNDWMERKNSDGDDAGSKFDAEHVQRSKLRIETRLKLLAKWDPKRYGDKLGIGGADGLPSIKTESTVAMAPEDAYKRMLEGG